MFSAWKYLEAIIFSGERHNNLPTASLLTRVATFVRDFFDRRVHSAEDIIAYVGLPIIASSFIIPMPLRIVRNLGQKLCLPKSRSLSRPNFFVRFVDNS